MFARTLAILAVLSAPLLAEDARDATPRVTQVALFKNGLAMVVTEVEVPQGTEWVRVRPLPAPVHGTFWLTSSSDTVEMHEVIATRDEAVEQVDATTVIEMLIANVGRDVVLTVDGGEYRGRLLSVPQDPVTPPESTDCSANPAPPYSSLVYYGGAYCSGPPSQTSGSPAAHANVVLVRTEQGVVALDRGSVRRVSFDPRGDDPATKWLKKRPGASLLLHAKATQPGARVVVSWLGRGLAWAPSYRMDVTDPEEGSLSATATLVNDLVDLSDTPVLLVSGFPNFAFEKVSSPLALNGDFDAFAQQLGYASWSRSPRNSLVTQQAVMSNSAANIEPEIAGGALQAMPGRAEEDMYFYDLGKVTLKRGQRGTFPMFTARTTYKDIYRWEIPDYVDRHDRYSSDDGTDKPEEVWHSLRMTNMLSTPWTTAPMLVTKDGKPLGQDTCFYTGPRATTLVRVTKALGIHAEEREVVTGRTCVQSWSGTLYKSTIKGELTITSFKDERIQVEVSKELSGELIRSDPEGDLTVFAHGRHRLNPTDRLTWTVPIEAGKDAKLTYEYEVLVRQ